MGSKLEYNKNGLKRDLPGVKGEVFSLKNK